MKTIRTALLFALALFLVVVACDRLGEQPRPEGNQGDYGKPHHILIRSLPDSQRNVAFGLIGDTHINASYAGRVPHVTWHWYGPVWWYDHCYRDTPHVKRNRHTIHSLNIHLGTTPNCHGIVHVGDMVDANNTQNLVAFRQLYECDYPGSDGGAIAGVLDSYHSAYSQGTRINKTVFPTVGNHDSPYYDDDPKDWHEPACYIRDLIKGTDGIVSYYDDLRSGAYAWRWGQYYFIQLGLWAGSDQQESNTFINYGKLRWLEAFLAEHVGDSGLGVLIFQHYGWDNMSTKTKWWNSRMRNLELDVLMRRPLGSGDTVPGNPYNVLGIFTGHCHSSHHFRVFAGLDAQGDSVFFENIIVNDGGSDSNYGYSIVELLGDELKLSTMTISDGPKYRWTYWSKPYHLGP
jgi:hypothetical protein